MKYRITDGVQYIDVERDGWLHRIYDEPGRFIRIVAPMFFETVKVRIRRAQHTDSPNYVIIHTASFVNHTPFQAAVFKAGRKGLVELKDAEVWLL